MSLVDPGTLWWNKYGIRRAGAWACWVLAVVAAFVGSWITWVGDATPLPLPMWVELTGSIIPLPLLLLGEFLWIIGTGRGDFDIRAIFMPIAAYFAALGLGGVLGRYQSSEQIEVTYAVFALGGLLALVIIEILVRRHRSAEALRTWVERNGTVTTGRVTRARTYSSNYRPMTRVTVKFVDSEARERWASQSVPGEFSTNSRLQVRYSQADLGRRAAVLITRR
ncbi:hypothetical protein [Brevibacterium oceani]|uniref:hypothetical protein n=1 Tax=Brevibacterium oceani TaxID=358099 RepID=UPI0015E7B0D5|nr:hypothetical protein [Brevibacterium oceani]